MNRTPMQIWTRSIRDGMLIGLFFYGLAFAGYILHDIVMPELSDDFARSFLSGLKHMMAKLGLLGPVVFMGIGAVIGAFPHALIRELLFPPRIGAKCDLTRRR